MRRAVVLGAYGFIGEASARALMRRGFEVVGVGRNRAAAERLAWIGDWAIRDIGRMDGAEWRELLDGAEVVVNAAGALQDGARDDLARVHEVAVAGLVEALEGRATRVIQISAAGVAPDASTEFFRSKARGDEILKGSGLDWVILRPVLVVGSAAFGGTALLRAQASMPLVFPKLFPESPVHCVALDDLAEAVADAAEGKIKGGLVADLTEDGSRSLAGTVKAVRRWLGFPDWRAEVAVPRWVAGVLARGADLAGLFGWRSPLRTTALRVLEDGISGDGRVWRAAGGRAIRPLEEVLAEMPVSLRDRWFARIYLMIPVLVGTLAVFWVLSGAIGIARAEEATGLLTARGVSEGLARATVIGGGVVDIALGLLVLSRRWARGACLGMVAVSAGYLLGGTVVAPDLWSDPLGPFVKILPALVLALFGAMILEER